MARKNRPEDRTAEDARETASTAEDTNADSLGVYGQEFIGDEEIADEQGVIVVNIGEGGVASPELLKTLRDNATMTIERISKDNALPGPGELNLTVVLADPQGKMYMLHHTKDGRMRFPSKAVTVPRTDTAGIEKAANDILFGYAGISVPHWEDFAYDEGTNTVYVRAYHRNIFDAAMVCPNGEGSMHVSPLDNILGGVIGGVNKHVKWITAVAAYGPLMSHLTFKCPVE